MSRPTLPPKTTKNIKEITPQTWNRLIDCVTYAMNHPRGDGQTITNDDSNGMLHLKDRPKTISSLDNFTYHLWYHTSDSLSTPNPRGRVFHTIEEFAESGLDEAIVFREYRGSERIWYPCYTISVYCILYRNMSVFKKRMISDKKVNMPIEGYLYSYWPDYYLDSRLPYDCGLGTITGYFRTILDKGITNGIVKFTGFDYEELMQPIDNPVCRLQPYK